jgi:hypothetical protein
MMNLMLLKALTALVPTCALFVISAAMLKKRMTVFSIDQVLGAGCLIVVVLTHVCEGLHWFAWMHWGETQGVGHCLDLWSAILGLTLFPAGYVLHRRERLAATRRSR